MHPHGLSAIRSLEPQNRVDTEACSDNNGQMSKKSIRFFNDRETFMKGIDYSYYYEER